MSVTQEAIDKIKAMIIDGDLRPGARLPKEADLAEQLGLSRNSLREAVRALTLIRILETRQGDGTYVTSLEPSVLLETMTFVADFHQDGSLLHVFQVRRILESAATSLAAQLITDDELQVLEELVGGMDACETVEAFVENDLVFHRTIALASRNPVFASLLESFSSRTSRARVWRGTRRRARSSRPRPTTARSTTRCATIALTSPADSRSPTSAASSPGSSRRSRSPPRRPWPRAP